ncbi:multicopper oxidase family protein [Thermus amyloliquefaciens]|uniref:multicopper oxidase family protein n=1 Tax=Thermus amyloliquefaciens TaxID=1449080 RepID=UPI00056F9CBA|nr:multicopper oxidase family protein [Thermus amyloliquefaciens]
MKANRRTLLKVAAGFLLSPLARGQASFPEPPVLQSREGLLQVRLKVAPTPVAVAGREAQLWTYGGSFPGPTLRVRPGDTVRLELENLLPEPTNLHWHGLPLSPKVDDPFLEIPSKETWSYAFAVPQDLAGTFWYHPHLHGRVAPQLFAGLAGAILVESPLDGIPELREAEEHLLVLKDLQLVGGRPAPHGPMDWINGKEGNLLLVNGASRPTLRAGKATLRLRLLNASNARYYRLQLEGHPLYLIASDGGFLEEPYELSELLLAPGERAEVLVRFQKEGVFRLLALPYDRGAHMMGGMEHMGHGGMPMGTSQSSPQTLLTLVAPPRPKPLPLPKALAKPSALNPSQARVTRRLTFTEDMMAGKFFINGQTFDHLRVDFQGRAGELEVWEVDNQGDMDHPFHLHTHPFQVLTVNGKPFPYRALKDVVNLKAKEVVRLLVPLKDLPGKTVFHCHIVEHEDRGMMGVLEVV